MKSMAHLSQLLKTTLLNKQAYHNAYKMVYLTHQIGECSNQSCASLMSSI